MADYYPLIARAVDGLTASSGEVRRALYERARTALITQLRSSDPPLSEADITSERLALEDAIRRVEADAAAAQHEAGAAAEAGHAAIPDAAASGEGESPDGEHPPDETAAAGDLPAESGPDALSDTVPAAAPRAERLRSVLAEAENLGAASAAAADAARENYDALPAGEPAGDDEGPDQRRVIGRAPPPPYPDGTEGVHPRLRSYAGMVKLALVLLLVAALAGIGYWQRGPIAALFATRQPAPVARDAAPGPGTAKPKIADRVAPGAQDQRPGTAPAADVAQKAVLYEEDPNDPQGKRYVGSVLWRSETVSPGPGLAPELAIRGDVEVPERRLKMTLSLRRNADKALPASHTIELMFNVPADFADGGISNVPGVLMKSGEQTRGTPLAGLAVKVTAGYFLIGLSATDAELQRNLQLLKERPWFDIPVVYNNGKRAILGVEKGPAGEHVFEDALRAWGQWDIPAP